MTTLKISSQLMLVIQLIQTKKEHGLILSELGVDNDWVGDIKEAYFALPDNVMTSTGLKKNTRCFTALFKFSIPVKWLSVQSEQHYFSF
ncbi:MAG: hypothetical protein ACI92O_000453 [Colwellia sp.]|jgi:hypothetical protein